MHAHPTGLLLGSPCMPYLAAWPALCGQQLLRSTFLKQVFLSVVRRFQPLLQVQAGEDISEAAEREVGPGMRLFVVLMRVSTPPGISARRPKRKLYGPFEPFKPATAACGSL